ncbi:WD40 repeat domain-containing protein [Micromonospora sp. NPDC049559]|uniref:WD40 repeat domain-containing protein n=1 Tax=Micromonospora sp. NPDC049559 TaxID=3155923 RepID=UPI00343CA705
MVAKLPLDSPHWAELSACYSRERAVELLRQIVASGRLGEPWRELQDEILHQGTVYGTTSAALPHLVDLAAGLPPETLADFWVEVGFLVTAGAGDFPEPPPVPGLQEGLTEALRTAETLALRAFLAPPPASGAAGPVPTADAAGSSYHALACVALAGHRTGGALWSFLSPTGGYVGVACPGCEQDHEVDGFADPLRPPVPFPPLPEPVGAARDMPGWADVAAAVEAARRAEVLGPGWDGLFRVAGAVATAGVPAGTPTPAVWCLVAAMVAVRGAAPWARTLARLAGHFRCGECDRTWPLGDLVGEDLDASPVDANRLDPATVADDSGFRPAPVGPPATAPAPGVRPSWRAPRAAGPVDALAALTLPDGRHVLAAAGPDGVLWRWDLADGTPLGEQPAGGIGPVSGLVPVPLPDGSVLLAGADGSGAPRWWDAATGRPLAAPATGDGVPVLSVAAVPMPPERGGAGDTWLGRLRDGRTVLVTGDAAGAVRLWDPATRRELGELFRRPGQPVVGMAVIDVSDRPPWSGGEVVTVHGDRTVDVWSSAAVTGERTGMAPDERRLAALGHEHLVAAAWPRGLAGYREPVLLADRNGTVSLWESFGVRLGDPLPADPAHADVRAVAALARPGGGLVVATVSGADRNLRLWEPATGGVRLVPLEEAPRCLLGIDSTLVVGHDAGLLTLTLDDPES